MQLTYLHIHNFKSIRDMEIRDIDRPMNVWERKKKGKTTNMNQ